MAVCAIGYVNVKILCKNLLDAFFIQHVPKKRKEYLKVIYNIQSILLFWRMRNLKTEVKIVIFKETICKLVFLDVRTKALYLEKLFSKIQHETLRLDKKSCDIHLKLVSLQCSWGKKLHDNCFHDWKTIMNELDFLVTTLCFI